LVIVKTVEGRIDLIDLEEQAKKNKDNLGAFMVTYPSTTGIYEDTIN
jgi:glycine dehydrogenase